MHKRPEKDLKNPPGQIVNNEELLEVIYKSGQMSEKQWQEHLSTDKTLRDYLERKYGSSK